MTIERVIASRVARVLALLSVASAIAVAPSSEALADEDGVPFWFLGQYASLAAVPTTPGWSLPLQAYYYGKASGDRSFTWGDSVTIGLKSRMPLILAQPTYAPQAKVFGAQLALGVGFGYGNDTTEADIAVSPRGTELGRSDAVWGFSDLYPVASLA
jgi:hypothetical protein